VGNISLCWRHLKERALARVSVNALALLSAQVGARLLNLFLIAQVTRVLGVAGLGRYLTVMTVEAIALAVVDLGLNTFVIRELARERSRQEVEALWGAVLGLKFLAALCGILVLNALVAPLVFPGERRVLIAIVSPALLTDAFNGVVAALIKARQRMGVSSGLALAVRFFTTLSGVVLVGRGYDEWALLAAYSAFSLLGAGAYAVVLRAWHIRPRWTNPFKTWRSILNESMPFAITGMVTMLYARLDLLVLSYWQGDAIAGLYGAVHRLWEALGMIPSSFLDALFPELSRLGGSAQGRARLRTLYHRGRTMLWLVVALLVAPCTIAAPYVLAFLYGETVDGATSIALLRILMLAFPFTFLYLLNGHALYAVGQQRRVTVVVVLVTAFKGLLNVLAVPTWSYWGAAGVAFVSEALLFVWLQIGVRRFVLRKGREAHIP
jgi:O-antigen/teichoic acid export membrane protein